MKNDNYATWLEIDLNAIKNNYKKLQQISKTPVMPIVKANAYGHGLEEVSKHLEQAGAEIFGVARIEEALILREYGIKSKILVLGYTSPYRIQDAIDNNISLTVFDFNVAKSYLAVLKKAKSRLNIHVKVDTGMGRLGVPYIDFITFIKFIAQKNFFQIEGLFTHFACADEPDKPYTKEQNGKFSIILDNIEALGLHPRMIHAANSAATLNFPETHYDFVRCGIALYGLDPSPTSRLPAGFIPALTWKSRLISIKILPKNHGVSYGFAYRTKKEEKIGVIAAGYGDGLRRRPGNEVLIHGKKAIIIGNVCMDQCVVKLDEIPEAKIGDEVILIGDQDGVNISATDIAEKWGTINYEVVCGMAARMPRIYND